MDAIRTLLRHLAGYLPITRRTHRALLRLALARYVRAAKRKKIKYVFRCQAAAASRRASHARQIADITEAARRFLDHTVRTDYRREEKTDRWSLMITIDPRTFALYPDTRERDLVAECIGSRVADEIRSLVFLRKARDLESERFRSLYRLPYRYGC